MQKKKAPECKRIPEQPPQAQNRAGSALGIFFHPDCTVGPGITTGLPKGSRAIPPVGNFTPP